MGGRLRTLEVVGLIRWRPLPFGLLFGVFLVTVLGWVMVAQCDDGKPALVGDTVNMSEGVEEVARERVLPPTPAIARRLLVADLRAFPEDLQLTMLLLQGIVNQKQPRIYFLLGEFDGQWAEWLKQRGDVDELQQLGLTETFDLIRQFRGELQGQVVVDPKLPATVNVATMLAGVKKLLITYPEYAERYADRYELPIVEDLRDRFKTSAEAYEWAWTTLRPYLTDRVLAMLHPTILALRDYLIQQRVFVWWQSGSKDGREPGNSPVDEMRVTVQVLRDSPVNIPVLGYPWRGDGVGPGEQAGVTLFSRFGKYLVPTDHASNLSVHSGAREVPIYLGSSERAGESVLREDAAYISYILSDGDNLQAWLNFFRKYWDSPAHGEVPIGWTIGPLALDLMPDVLDYLQRTRRPSDSFLCAVSGIGYAYLEHYGEALASREEAVEGFLKLTARYMERLGLDMIWPMAGEGPVPDWVLELYASHIPGLRAIYPDYGQRVAGYKQANMLLNAGERVVPVFRALGSGGVRMGAELDRLLHDAPRPAFVHGFIHNWSHTMEDLVELARSTGDRYVFVRPEELAALFRVFATRAGN
ncbi:MAG: hypothetical protein IMX00_00665 [Limnochordales bacterium]|nr:hypothetical protein [Limnochordales bacterium]